MQTEKLFYADPFQREFTAAVTACFPLAASASQPDAVQSWRVVLDRTAFYPEGGGQPADHGSLDGVPVLDVHERDGEIFHVCAAPLEVGKTVCGQIDWERRFDHMQQHSGEHILSGMICASHGYDNVGFHLGAETVTIDFNGPLTNGEVLELESRANQYIYEDHAITVSFPSPEELAALDYRSKKELSGSVRIVAFSGADCCACCGTHVLRSGQVGLLKILSWQKFREGVRLEIVCGRRALCYLSAVYEQNRAVGQALSAKGLETAAAVERLQTDLSAAKAEAARWEAAVFSAKAAALSGAGDALLIEPPLSGDGARRLADAVGKTCGGLAAVFSGSEGRYNYALIRADGGDLSALVRAMNGALNGRGGGRKGFAQGSVQADEASIRTFFSEARL